MHDYLIEALVYERHKLLLEEAARERLHKERSGPSRRQGWIRWLVTRWNVRVQRAVINGYRNTKTAIGDHLLKNRLRSKIFPN